jgi:glutamate synthase (ferredoxin)
MTGGRVVVLGATGRNFAAGMSGGIAWVLDPDGTFASRCNREMISIEPVAVAAVVADADESAELRDLVERHAGITGSERAAALLADWETSVRSFVRVVPHDYRRVLDAQARMRAAGLSDDDAEMAAFAENVADLARVGGS